MNARMDAAVPVDAQNAPTGGWKIASSRGRRNHVNARNPRPVNPFIREIRVPLTRMIRGIRVPLTRKIREIRVP